MHRRSYASFFQTPASTLSHTFQYLCPRTRAPTIPCTQRTEQTVSQAIIRDNSTRLIQREQAAGLTEQLLMVGDQLRYLPMQLADTEETQADVEFIAAPLHL